MPAAADGDELAAGARAGLVDHPRRQLLAGPEGPVIRIRLLAGAILAMVLRSCWMAAERPADAVGRHGLGAQSTVLTPQRGRLHGALHHQQQPVGLERLLQEVIGAALDGADGGFDVAVAGDHHHRHVRVHLLDHVEQFEPVEPAALHPDVLHQERRPTRTDGRQRGMAVGGRADGVTLVLQDAGNQFANVGFVVDD